MLRGNITIDNIFQSVHYIEILISGICLLINLLYAKHCSWIEIVTRKLLGGTLHKRHVMSKFDSLALNYQLICW